MNVLLSGGSSGIGNAVLKYFKEKGINVYSLDIKDLDEDNVISYKVDLTDVNELIRIKEEFKKENIRFDAIVNVAGKFIIDSFIEVSDEELKRLIDVNLMACINLNKIFFELLNEKGRIIITSSEVSTLDPLPFNGIYSVSKCALDAYSQALRQELNLLNYKVITIRPGAFNTNLSRSSLVQTRELMDKTKLYSKQSHKFYNLVKKFMGKPSDPKKICNIYYKALTKKRPKLVYKKHINKLLVLLSVLPKRMQLFIIKRLLK